MLLQHLGPAIREATDEEGAALAVRVHQVCDTGSLPALDGPGLAAMPRRMIDRFGRLGIDGAALEVARVLEKLAPERSEGAATEPFGLCHPEWHPTSVHIGATGVHLLDLARAFRGPGLLDLASWHGTI